MRSIVKKYALLILVLAVVGLMLQSCNQVNNNKLERPNILFCIADDASFAHMGAYGCDWVKTPSFDRIAQQGLLFANTYTPNAKCAPSRSCILTGRNTWQLEEACNHWPVFPQKFKVYPEVLEENGYFVGTTGKGWAPGIARTAEGDPRHLTGKPFKEKWLTPPTNAISGQAYSENFADFLDAIPDNQPWCFWYGGYEPHRAYEYGTGVSLGGKSIDDVDHVPEMWPDTEVTRNDLLDYAFEIEYFDAQLGQMLAQLEEKGLLENTLVVVTADNGMPFPMVKGQEYEYSNHLPLAIMWKDGIKNPGRIVEDFVSFIDFAPTFLELAGTEWSESGMHESPGKSLTALFKDAKSKDGTPHREHVIFGKERHDIGRPDDVGYPIRGIIKNDYLYLRNFEPSRWPAGNPETGYLNSDGSPTKSLILDMRRKGSSEEYWKMSFGKRPYEELYNISEDPFCINNLAEDSLMELKKTALWNLLQSELMEQNDPRMGDMGYIFDQYQYADSAGLDFYNRFMAGEKLSAAWVEATDFETEPISE